MAKGPASNHYLIIVIEQMGVKFMPNHESDYKINEPSRSGDWFVYHKYDLDTNHLTIFILSRYIYIFSNQNAENQNIVKI